MEGMLRELGANIGQYGGDLSKFFYGAMTQPPTDLSGVMDIFGQMGDISRQKAWREAMGRGYGAGSTAAIRSGLGAMREGDLRSQLAAAGLGLDVAGQEFGRRMAGAQGLMGMPGYYAAPTSVEMGLLNLLQQGGLANLQAQMGTQGLQAGAMGDIFAQQQTQPVMMPGWGQTIASPILEAIASAATLIPFI